MYKLATLIICLMVFSIPAFGQVAGESAPDSGFKIALASHPGQLQWRAEGFKIIESSAKSKGQEIGLRGKDASGRLEFLGFLFVVSDEGALSSEKCRDGALAGQKKNPTLKAVTLVRAGSPDSTPLALATYSNRGRDGKTWYTVRGFLAKGDTCGDLEFYSTTVIGAEDADLKKIFESFRLDANYVPQFRDIFLYAQILYQHEMYKAAAPIFEQARDKLGDDKTQRTMRRVTTDQAGMSYGISGDIPKARALFETAIANDPDYPMYYYNQACADAEEKKLADARRHLQEAFARKANMTPGESLPNPTKDDSFTPYKNDKEFWTFLEGLH